MGGAASKSGGAGRAAAGLSAPPASAGPVAGSGADGAPSVAAGLLSSATSYFFVDAMFDPVSVPGPHPATDTAAVTHTAATNAHEILETSDWQFIAQASFKIGEPWHCMPNAAPRLRRFLALPVSRIAIALRPAGQPRLPIGLCWVCTRAAACEGPPSSRSCPVRAWPSWIRDRSAGSSPALPSLRSRVRRPCVCH